MEAPEPRRNVILFIFIFLGVRLRPDATITSRFFNRNGKPCPYGIASAASCRPTGRCFLFCVKMKVSNILAPHGSVRLSGEGTRQHPDTGHGRPCPYGFVRFLRNPSSLLLYLCLNHLPFCPFGFCLGFGGFELQLPQVNFGVAIVTGSQRCNFAKIPQFLG